MPIEETNKAREDFRHPVTGLRLLLAACLFRHETNASIGVARPVGLYLAPASLSAGAVLAARNLEVLLSRGE